LKYRSDGGSHDIMVGEHGLRLVGERLLGNRIRRRLVRERLLRVRIPRRDVRERLLWIRVLRRVKGNE
jgi:hypothetical protein